MSVRNDQEEESLAKLRSRIDEIDSELLKLLNKRAKCVIKIGKIKPKLYELLKLVKLAKI